VYGTCLGFLGRCDANKYISICCGIAQGNQEKYGTLGIYGGVSAANFAGVNTALLKVDRRPSEFGFLKKNE